MNWHHVYNALVIPVLTYGVLVWYTGINQKGLVARMQVTQNDGLRKLTGVFKTAPIEPLHSLTQIPPITYLMGKLMHSYTLRLGCMPPHVKVRTVLTTDQCRYWPEYVTPPTNLSHTSLNAGPTTYVAPTLCTARAWTHPRFVYIPQPFPKTVLHHKQSRERREASDTHIYIIHTLHNHQPYTTFHITQGLDPIVHRVTMGLNQTQALCQAVHEALTTVTTHPTSHTFL